MNNINYYLSIIWNQKIKILVICAVASLIAVIVTMPQICPRLYEAKYEYKLKNIPELINIDVTGVIIQAKKKHDIEPKIIAKYSHIADPITAENFNKRVIYNVDKVGKVSIIVKHKDKKTAVNIANDLFTLLNHKIHDAVCVDYFAKIQLNYQKIELKKQEIDSVKQQLSQKKSLNSYQQLHKTFSGEMDPDIIYNQSLLMNYSMDIDKINTEIQEFDVIIKTPTVYLRSINNYNLNNVKIIPNRIVITSFTLFITLIGSMLFFILK